MKSIHSNIGNGIDIKIENAKKIILSAYNSHQNKVAIAWTGGKDSTVILHIAKKLFGKVPFPVIFNDSTLEFEEVYEFIERIFNKWSLNLKIVPYPIKEMNNFYLSTSIKEKHRIIREAKITAINQTLKKYKLEGFISGIRRDEHESRSHESYISPRNDHIRYHPILDFSELDIWRYIRKNNVPYVNLYDKGYRSLGEKPFTTPSIRKDERAGRQPDKEVVMEELRSRGYW